MKKIKIGLLPLYVELYDHYLAWMRPAVEKFYENAAAKLEEEGLEVIKAPVCRLENEFRTAIQHFEAQEAEAVVTLHLAYSPSLQSEVPLKECKLPIIVFDTTPDYVFEQEGPTGLLDYNHGIHGVQDMCNLLIRNGKHFDIFTGHYTESDICKQIADCVRAHAVANALSKAKVGIIGEPFDGMGDFRVPYEELKRDIGIQVVPYSPSTIDAHSQKVTNDQINSSKAEDTARFDMVNIPDDLYHDVTKVSLGVKNWYTTESLTAFTVNFLASGKNTGLRYMPFDRACRAMEEGIGYAGEGDVLTAALVGALLRVWENTTFMEMFCPNWRDEYLFMSHMGEYNLRVACNRPKMLVRAFPYTDAGDPYAIMGSLKEGRATLINLAPFGNGTYALTAVNGQMLPISEKSNFKDLVNGWFKPDCGLPHMLKKYSEYGATHHCAIVYGVGAEIFAPMAKRFGWSFHEL